MRAPDFWWRATPSLPAHLLAPLGALWGAVARRRMAMPGEAASIPVICVGNPVAGGAGKTPAALEIARLLIAAGRRPVFLTRGYGGNLSGPVHVDPALHSSREVGDEPLLLVRTAPCVVAHDRVAGAKLAAASGDVIVMDDGFQNPSLTKNLALLVVDAAMGAGNGLCIPAGPLRAPIDAQLTRAHAVIVIGEGGADGTFTRQKNIPVFRARILPDLGKGAGERAADLENRRVLAFAGIGRPKKFAETLKSMGADVVRLVEFPDHHAFTASDARALLAEAKRDGLMLVTTEKDHVRLADAALSDLAKAARAIPVRLAFDTSKEMTAFLSKVFA
jgi:tetraacyldisaccharide 4'-kinase